MNAAGAWDEIQLAKHRRIEPFRVPDSTRIFCAGRRDMVPAGTLYSAGEAAEGTPYGQYGGSRHSQQGTQTTL